MQIAWIDASCMRPPDTREGRGDAAGHATQTIMSLNELIKAAAGPPKSTPLQLAELLDPLGENFDLLKPCGAVGFRLLQGLVEDLDLFKPCGAVGFRLLQGLVEDLDLFKPCGAVGFRCLQ